MAPIFYTDVADAARAGIIAKPIAVETAASEGTPVPDWYHRQREVELADGTLCLSYDAHVRPLGVEGFQTGSAASKPSRENRLLVPLRDEEGEPVTTATRARDQRLALLARKYAASKASPEDEGRIRILTERMRKLVPHVTESDVTRLEEAQAVATDVAQNLAELRARFGLR